MGVVKPVVRKSETDGPVEKSSDKSAQKVHPLEAARIVVEQFSSSFSQQDRLALQEFFLEWGIYNGKIDGKWGNQTKTSLEIFFSVLEEKGINYSVASSEDFTSTVNKILSLGKNDLFTQSSSSLGSFSSIEGEYDAQGLCDLGGASESSLTVSLSSFDFYDSSCRISESINIGVNKTAITLKCEGEGGNFQRLVSVYKDDKGDLFLEEDDYRWRYRACK